MKAQMMNAVVCTKYGAPEVLQLQKTNIPQPKENEVLVRIFATSATSGDARIRRADPAIIKLLFGFKKPKRSILGVVVAGEVIATGSAVTKFKAGDSIFGTTGMEFGTYAEFTTIPEDGVLALKPSNINYQEAAAIPFGATAALYFLRKAKIQAGQRLLVYGASGAIGTAAIQIAKSFGAEVTAVCSERNFTLVKSLGADKVIDYTKEDFSENGEEYEIIFDTVGKSSFSKCINSLSTKGILLMASAGLVQMFQGLIISMTTSKKVFSGVVEENAEIMDYLSLMVETGQLLPVIDRSYSLGEIVKAHQYVDTGRKKGNVIIALT